MAAARSGGALRHGPARFVDLHCHTRPRSTRSPRPRRVDRAAAARGLTHLAITDHDRIDGALEGRARSAAELAPELTVIVGQEIRTADGDLIALFLSEAVPPGLSRRRSDRRGPRPGRPRRHPASVRPVPRLAAARRRLERLVAQVDWIEAHNARVMVGNGNQRAAELARAHGLPGIAVSDAHSDFEVGVAYTALDGDPSTPAGLLAALPTRGAGPGPGLVLRPRSCTPVAKVVQRARGNGRVSPGRRSARVGRP